MSALSGTTGFATPVYAAEPAADIAVPALFLPQTVAETVFEPSAASALPEYELPSEMRGLPLGTTMLSGPVAPFATEPAKETLALSPAYRVVPASGATIPVTATVPVGGGGQSEALQAQVVQGPVPPPSPPQENIANVAQYRLAHTTVRWTRRPKSMLTRSLPDALHIMPVPS